MNLRKTCPDTPDGWKGSITDACRILGDGKPISNKTVRKRLSIIKPVRGTNRRIQLTGKDVKLLWRMI